MIVKPDTAPENPQEPIPLAQAGKPGASSPIETNAHALSSREPRAEVMSDNVHVLNLEPPQRPDPLSGLTGTDDITGIANDRFFRAQTSVAVERAYRISQPVALLFCDVDSLKRYNDHFGRDCGDEVLRWISAFLRVAGRRRSDLAARRHSDEFALLLPNTGSYAALVLADRFCRNVAGSSISFGADSREINVTVSVGVTVYPASAKIESADLIGSAGEALEQARRAGGNCTRFRQL